MPHDSAGLASEGKRSDEESIHSLRTAADRSTDYADFPQIRTALPEPVRSRAIVAFNLRQSVEPVNADLPLPDNRCRRNGMSLCSRVWYLRRYS